jgi:acid phosphatase (class A)
MRKFFLVPALLLCLGGAPALALSDAPYLIPGAFDSVHLLPPPPARDSLLQKQDIENVLEAQRAASPERVKLAEDDAKVDINRFAFVLAPNFSFDGMPDVVAFFRKVGRDTNRPVTIAKDCWERRRPFVADSRVHPPGKMQPETANRPGAAVENVAPHDPASLCLPVEPAQLYSYSYPSGHSTFGAMTAILLSNMVPEKQAELFARGWDYGQSRVIGGVHFPTDVESGRIEATAMVALMMQNGDFRTDFAAAKAELRKGLGLSQ